MNAATLSGVLYYRAPPTEAGPVLELVPPPPNPGNLRFPFHRRLEIGRHVPAREKQAGVLLVADPKISYRHCILRQDPDGRCFVRDLSRNGTRLDGRRLVPNLDVEMRRGQTLTLGGTHRFTLEGDPPAATPEEIPAGGTEDDTDVAEMTVLVGDIRGYTELVHSVPPAELQQAVTRVFEIIEQAVVAHDGVVKEYQGDAVFAFWEHGPQLGSASDGCSCALALDRLIRALADERAAWPFPDRPLAIDFALTTGIVAIQRLGSQVPTALSLVGDLVPLAYQLEKLATDETGNILACERTRELARESFEFRDLGELRINARMEPTRVFALVGESRNG